MNTQEVDVEGQLVTYLENILKCQIIPMNFMSLRGLVQEAPKNSKLFEFIETVYPNDQFLEFLRKYPHIFTLNPDRSVILSQGNNFTLPYGVTSQQSEVACDEVDASNRKEYISDTDSDDDDANEESRLMGISGNQSASLNRSRATNLSSSSSSSLSGSSADIFSSEIIQTSDSDANSVSSDSSLDN